MTETALNGLLNYILSLNLSNRSKDWLAGKILETKTPKTKSIDSAIERIPEEYRCDPFEVSPSGDPFFADKRNVDEIRFRSENIHSGESELIEIEDIDKFFETI